MAQEAAIQPHAAASTFQATTSAIPEVKLISRSNVFYWWPAWLAGYTVALITFLYGHSIAIEPGIAERVHPSNNPGLAVNSSEERLSARKADCGRSLQPA